MTKPEDPSAIATPARSSVAAAEAWSELQLPSPTASARSSPPPTRCLSKLQIDSPARARAPREAIAEAWPHVAGEDLHGRGIGARGAWIRSSRAWGSGEHS